MSTVESRVNRGVGFLDSHFPGWVDKINLDTLSTGGNDNCLIGQLTGSFGKLKEIDPMVASAPHEWGFFPLTEDIATVLTKYGFGGFWTHYHRESLKLDKAWKDKITKLRSQEEEPIPSPYQEEVKKTTK